MSQRQKVKISIADRVYPLTIEPSREEGLRIAAKNIEKMIQQLENNYAVRDKQDVLAMCALQFAAQAEQIKIDKNSDVENAKKMLDNIEHLLDNHLS
ncbi:cell divonision ZapA family protein [Nonlabens tegetincola]|uniref:Cell divonision ZapA family protein n=1 Tax=Nonlabens tegetincola TaxID=323273 RepID=A0A090PZQ1_9FLAO|nr:MULTISPECIES: cell division protein ZapA [Nonlabens]MEE2801834.1 cell division protein ZapA [Bacteroidota bacterium]ALM21586.1 cell division protein ZapA [Nonlabens sp. MIC269]ARN71687.1 cell division protein ZapA [Nonlabens tegetincola]PQJ14196.1 cell division protein ZapA [Nonlabens tegetincola]GAK96324.1 cell divonision ZapA family protein [Nonlabens tegetincola]